MRVSRMFAKETLALTGAMAHPPPPPLSGVGVGVDGGGGGGGVGVDGGGGGGATVGKALSLEGRSPSSDWIPILA